jgi:hypothetical protein
MSEAQILAIAGTTASACSMIGGWLSLRFQTAGAFLIGVGGAVMLAGNLTVIYRGLSRNARPTR